MTTIAIPQRFRVCRGRRDKCSACVEQTSITDSEHKVRFAEFARVMTSDGRGLCWHHYNEEVLRDR